jgi:AAA+ superfamily predicted ATPase
VQQVKVKTMQARIPFPDKFRNYTKASYAALAIRTHEETRAINDVIDAFKNATTPVIFYSWDVQNNLTKYKKKANGEIIWEKVPGDTGPLGVVKFCRTIGTKNERSIVFMKDFHEYIGAPLQVRMIRNALEDLKANGTMLVFLGPVTKIPIELEKEIQILDYNLPSEEHLERVLDSVNATVKKRYENDPPKWQLTPEIRTGAVEAAKGMTYQETHDAFSLAIVENQKFDNGFVLSVFEEKVKQVKRHGLLQYLIPDITFDNIGGMDQLKKWIKTRACAYSENARKYQLPYPKGILLCGIPGCGKTLLAKATSTEFGFPLFQLDMGSLFGRHVGETEENFRKVVETVDGIGRCILFIDEIEKSLNRNAVSGQGDTGTSSRSFATLLTWLSEHKTPVFVIGTSNDHTKLPTEFTRKGRFDELFWIDLPSESERKEIFNVLLKRYGRDPKALKLDVTELAQATEQFTGAEIENVIVGAMFDRFALDGKEICTANLIDEVNATKPLAVIAKDDIENMRKNAEGKLRPTSSLGVARSLEASKGGTGRNVQLDI